MNRRAFLSTLAAGLAGAALDPERLLWVPGAKTIFLPSPKLALPFRIGDVFTIQGVFAINPLTHQATEHLQWFVVTGYSPAGAPLLSPNPI